jgi:uncharacterized repeat protein (TIGR03803 family)
MKDFESKQTWTGYTTRTVQHRGWHSGIRRRVASAALTLVVVLGLGVVSTRSAQAQTYTESVLYTFTGGADGGLPVAGLIFDGKGNLYGTTNVGGASGVGVVFKVDSKGKETVLYSFTGGADGRYPGPGSLIWDAKGNLYGTTGGGGDMSACHDQGCGVVFKVDSTGKETVLYSFTGGADGGSPEAGLIWDVKGNLYGTTSHGGGSSGCRGRGCGTVFKLNKNGEETVLYSFTGGADGADPEAGLIWDVKGNLYGTTVSGGDMSACHDQGCGVVFKVDSTGKETVLYTFTGGADGANLFAGLIWDAKGNLYGTTDLGGDMSACLDQGCGVVFKVDSTGKETVLYTFTGGADGREPFAGLIWDAREAEGPLYGTTTDGGEMSGCPYGCGTVFKVDSTGKETVLYSFTGGADEGYPQAGLIWDAKGNLYGTTTGGPSAFGTVFKLAP